MKNISVRKGESLLATVLRLFRMNHGLGEGPSGEETALTVIPTNYQRNYHRIIGAACLDIERKKAEALMELQRRRVIY